MIRAGWVEVTSWHYWPLLASTGRPWLKKGAEAVRRYRALFWFLLLVPPPPRARRMMTARRAPFNATKKARDIFGVLIKAKCMQPATFASLLFHHGHHGNQP